MWKSIPTQLVENQKKVWASSASWLAQIRATICQLSPVESMPTMQRKSSKTKASGKWQKQFSTARWTLHTSVAPSSFASTWSAQTGRILMLWMEQRHAQHTSSQHTVWQTACKFIHNLKNGLAFKSQFKDQWWPMFICITWTLLVTTVFTDFQVKAEEDIFQVHFGWVPVVVGSALKLWCLVTSAHTEHHWKSNLNMATFNWYVYGHDLWMVFVYLHHLPLRIPVVFIFR